MPDNFINMPMSVDRETPTTHYITTIFNTGSKELADFLAANTEGKHLQGNAVIESVETATVPPNPSTGIASTRVDVKISKIDKSAAW